MNSTASPQAGRAGPAWTLVVLAPVIAELLPGATRISSSFVLPIEMGIWGGGALLIRAAVRHWRLGWLNMLSLALALAIAEECLIQQTSLAPMVVQIFPGQPFARAWGVNYVYLLWALFYEAVFVVFVPITLTELIFRSRREDPWLRKWSAWLTGGLFLLACLPAWYSWTQIARPQVFKVPVYNPPLASVAIATVSILLLVFAALGPRRRALLIERKTLPPPAPWVLAAAGFIAAMVWHCLVLLAFGIRPSFPVWIATAVGVVLPALALYLLPRFAAHPAWRDTHRLWLLFGGITGAMVSGFAAFIYGTLKIDLYGKIILDVVATVLLIWLAILLNAEPVSGASTIRAS